MKIDSALEIKGLELEVFLGWLPKEHTTKQTVVVDINIDFLHPPKACETDELDDTFCYDTLIATIRKNTATTTYRLIEHLGQALYKMIKNTIFLDTNVQIRLSKKPAYIADLHSVVFCYGDTTW